MRPTDRPSPRGGFYREDAGTAVVELIDCTITKFGYPNDEAWMRIPRTKGLSYGIYEVKNSAWPDEIAALNRHAFPGPQRRRGRHFLFLFHDSSLECIAGELSLTLRSEPYPEIMAELTAWWDHV